MERKPNAEDQAPQEPRGRAWRWRICQGGRCSGFNDIDRIKKNPDLDPSMGGRNSRRCRAELEKKRKVLVWNQDLEAAKAQAAKEKKDLFLYFGGSDWCPRSAP